MRCRGGDGQDTDSGGDFWNRSAALKSPCGRQTSHRHQGMSGTCSVRGRGLAWGEAWPLCGSAGSRRKDGFGPGGSGSSQGQWGALRPELRWRAVGVLGASGPADGNRFPAWCSHSHLHAPPGTRGSSCPPQFRGGLLRTRGHPPRLHSRSPGPQGGGWGLTVPLLPVVLRWVGGAPGLIAALWTLLLL